MTQNDVDQSDRTPRIPTVEVYRGVGIHDFQPAERIAAVVKPAIDRVYTLGDPTKLFAYAEDPRNPPEARLFAAARCRAAWEIAAEDREKRPHLDMSCCRHTWPG